MLERLLLLLHELPDGLQELDLLKGREGRAGHAHRRAWFQVPAGGGVVIIVRGEHHVHEREEGLLIWSKALGTGIVRVQVPLGSRYNYREGEKRSYFIKPHLHVPVCRLQSRCDSIQGWDQCNSVLKAIKGMLMIEQDYTTQKKHHCCMGQIHHWLATHLSSSPKTNLQESGNPKSFTL